VGYNWLGQVRQRRVCRFPYLRKRRWIWVSAAKGVERVKGEHLALVKPKG